MKLASMITIPAVAVALAANTAFADNTVPKTITVNGRTYTLTEPGTTTTASKAKGGCCGSLCGMPGRTFSFGTGRIEIPGKFSAEDIQNRMKELANDPEATVVKDDDGNIKSVKVSKSSSGGKVIKDGKVVESWGDIEIDDDFGKMIEERMKELENDPEATVVREDDGNVKTVKVSKSTKGGQFFKNGELVKSWGDEGPGEEIQKMIDDVRAQCLAASKSAAPAAKNAAKAKAVEHKADAEEIKAIRQRIEELKKLLDSEDFAE